MPEQYSAFLPGQRERWIVLAVAVAVVCGRSVFLAWPCPEGAVLIPGVDQCP